MCKAITPLLNKFFSSAQERISKPCEILLWQLLFFFFSNGKDVKCLSTFLQGVSKPLAEFYLLTDHQYWQKSRSCNRESSDKEKEGKGRGSFRLKYTLRMRISGRKCVCSLYTMKEETIWCEIGTNQSSRGQSRLAVNCFSPQSNGCFGIGFRLGNSNRGGTLFKSEVDLW